MAVRFDSGLDRLVRSAALPDDDAFSVSGWAYLVSSNGFDTLFFMNSTRAMQLNGGSGVLSIHDGNASTDFSTSPSAGVWFWWGLTCNGTTLTGYWSPANLLTTNTVSDSSIASGTPTELVIGNTVNDEYWNGRIAAVKIWDAALTQTQMEAERYTYLPQRWTSLHLWAPMIGTTTATAALDYSGAGKDFTVESAPTIEDGPPIVWQQRRGSYPSIQTAGAVQNVVMWLRA